MKAVIIGLGGAGVSIAAHLKAKLISDGAYDPNTTRFLFLDTATDAKERLQKMYNHIPELFNEFVDLGSCVPHQVWRENVAVQAWVSNPELLSNQPLRYGAGAFRQQGRLALARAKEHLRAKVEEALDPLIRQTTEEETGLAILPIASSCGGTGSSMLLDVLALVGTIFYEKVHRDPSVFPIIILPESYIAGKDSGTAEKYRANAYAFFQELSDLSALRNDPTAPGRFCQDFSLFPGANTPQSFFTMAFCVDTLTSEGRVLKAPEPFYSTVAEGLRAFLGVGLSELTTQLVNVRQNLEAQEPRFRKVMATFGVRALRFPSELFARYLQERFAFEAFDALWGPGLQQVFPDVRELKRFLDETFQKIVGRFVFAFACSPGDDAARTQNLESNLLSKLSPSLEVSDGRFRTNGKPDKDKIRDQGLVAQYVREVQDLAIRLQQQLLFDLESEKEPWSLPAILRAIEKQLEVEVEETILRWGTRAAQELVARLDVMCAELLATPQPDGDLNEQIRNTSAELQAEEQSIKNALDNWPAKAGPKELGELLGHLRSWLNLSARLFILTQQKTVLEWLCLNEQGLLDRWKHRLAELARQVADYASLARRRYLDELPKTFVETGNDATTLFLPNVSRFVAGGSWTRDNEFALLYRKLVPEDPEDASKALRYEATSKGLGSERKGLHALFTELKVRGPKPVGGRDPLFTPAIREGSTDAYRALLEELRGALEQFVLDLAQVQEEIRTFLENSLSDRLQALPEIEREKVYGTFEKGLVFLHGHAAMPYSLRIVEVDQVTKHFLVDANVIPENATANTVPIISRVPSRAVTLFLEYATTHEEIQRPGTWERYREAAQSPNRIVPSFLDGRFEKAGGLLGALAPSLSGEELGRIVGRTFAKTYLLTKLAASPEGRDFLATLFQTSYFSAAPPTAPLTLASENLIVPSVAVAQEQGQKRLRKINEPDIRVAWTNHAQFLLFLATNSKALQYLEAWCQAVEEWLPGQSGLSQPLQDALVQCQHALQSAAESDRQNQATYRALEEELVTAKRAWEQLIVSRTTTMRVATQPPRVQF